VSTYFDSIVKLETLVHTIRNRKSRWSLVLPCNSNEYFIPITGNINVEEEIAKLTAELNYTKVLKSVQGKLSNENL
jgi:valyl-tRNA synthetase